jgi:hypothetical protein
LGIRIDLWRYRAVNAVVRIARLGAETLKDAENEDLLLGVGLP